MRSRISQKGVNFVVQTLTNLLTVEVATTNIDFEPPPIRVNNDLYLKFNVYNIY